MNKPSKAFTLLEVLIAMAIFSLAAVGLLTNLNVYQNAQVTSIQRTVGHWVAMNQVAETRLDKRWPNVGVTRGSTEMSRKTWHWIQTVSKTTEKNLRKVEVEVRVLPDDELPITKFAGFIANKQISK